MWIVKEASELIYMSKCDDLDSGYCSRSVTD